MCYVLLAFQVNNASMFVISFSTANPPTHSFADIKEQWKNAANGEKKATQK
jgi:hypothetical protein